jgi:hypothetical protein
MSSSARSAALKMLRLVLATSSIGGCATDHFENACSLIPLRRYSLQETSEIARERDAVAPGALWPTFLEDYAALRDAVRACAEVKP